MRLFHGKFESTEDLRRADTKIKALPFYLVISLSSPMSLTEKSMEGSSPNKNLLLLRSFQVLKSSFRRKSGEILEAMGRGTSYGLENHAFEQVFNVNLSYSLNNFSYCSADVTVYCRDSGVH